MFEFGLLLGILTLNLVYGSKFGLFRKAHQVGSSGLEENVRFKGVHSSGFLSFGLGLVISGGILCSKFRLFEFWPRFGHFWVNYVRS